MLLTFQFASCAGGRFAEESLSSTVHAMTANTGIRETVYHKEIDRDENVSRRVYVCEKITSSFSLANL